MQKIVRGCCKKLKLRKALTENIIKWLKINQDELNKIDFRVDINGLD